MTDKTAVLIGTLNTGDLTDSYHASIRALQERHYDHDSIRIYGHSLVNPGPFVADGRNRLARELLDSDAEWLWMVDADMGFNPDTLQRLHDAAHPTERPVVGALCFMWRRIGSRDHRSLELEASPTLWTYRRWEDDDGTERASWANWPDYPPDRLVKVDATGGACLLIHRTVLERLKAERGEQWFTRVHAHDTSYGEDMSFCLQCKAAGIPVHVHTGIGTSHKKQVHVDEDLFRRRRPPPTVVGIPVKDRLDLTKHLVGQIAEDRDGHDLILILDNGSTDGTAEWADGHPQVERVDCPDVGIHSMWNVTVERALELSLRANVVLLNNDLTFDVDRPISRLTGALRDCPHAAVSGNYDRRRGELGDRVPAVEGICAGRYDGTGGLAGFCMAVKGEWFTNGYRFPEELMWWFGDNHLVASMAAAGHTVGVALDCPVTHVDGGGQTGDWDDPAMRKVLAEDRRTFERLMSSNGQREAVPA